MARPADIVSKSLIWEKARELGIDGIGFADAEPLDVARSGIQAAVSSGYIPRDLAPSEKSLARFTDPRRHLSGARSIIAAYECYYRLGPGEEEPDDPLVGTIARYTRSNFYEDLHGRLRRLASFMAQELSCRTKTFCCYVSLAEKPIALKAGLGFYGKHGVIVTPKHGSYVVLGEILTDLEMEPDAQVTTDCGDCRLCIEACPTGAIREPYFVDRALCIQAHCGRRTAVPMEVRNAWGNRFYGCMACQEACPRNRDAAAVERYVEIGRVGSNVFLPEMLLIDEHEFIQRFGGNQIGLRDRSVIRRDAILAAGCSGSPVFEAPLAECALDDDPIIRQHALWALFRIKGESSRQDLIRARENEARREHPDPQIQIEIKTLLDGFSAF
jgi:epoxyqueuosine reductase